MAACGESPLAIGHVNTPNADIDSEDQDQTHSSAGRSNSGAGSQTSSAGSSLPDSLKEALDDDDNILVSMHYPKLAQEYW